MLINTQGLVIKTIKYGDTSIITTIFTKSDGLKSFIVNGVRSKRSVMPYGLFQPGTLLDFSMYHNELKKLLRLKEARIAITWHRIPFEIKRSSVVLFICELIEKTLREADLHEMLYDELIGLLKFIDSTDVSIANIPLMFMLNLSNHLGFGPQGIYSEQTPVFDLQEGYFIASPITLHFMDNHHSEKFSLLLAGQSDLQTNVILGKTERKEIFNAMLKYYSLHIENFTGLRSPEVFQSIMEI